MPPSKPEVVDPPSKPEVVDPPSKPEVVEPTTKPQEEARLAPLPGPVNEEEHNPSGTKPSDIPQEARGQVPALDESSKQLGTKYQSLQQKYKAKKGKCRSMKKANADMLK